MPTHKTALTLLCLLASFSLQAETLISNVADSVAGTPSPFHNGNGKAVDFMLMGKQAFELQEVVLRLKLTTDSRPRLRLVGAAVVEIQVKGEQTAGEADDVFVPQEQVLLMPRQSYRIALSTDTPGDGMLWLSGAVPVPGQATHIGQAYGQGEPIAWQSPSKVVNLYELRGEWSNAPVPKLQKDPEGERLISNLGKPHSRFKQAWSVGRNGKATDFRFGGDRPFEVKAIKLALRMPPEARPELLLVGTPRDWQDRPVGLNRAASAAPPRCGFAFAAGRSSSPKNL